MSAKEEQKERDIEGYTDKVVGFVVLDKGDEYLQTAVSVIQMCLSIEGAGCTTEDFLLSIFQAGRDSANK